MSINIYSLFCRCMCVCICGVCVRFLSAFQYLVKFCIVYRLDEWKKNRSRREKKKKKITETKAQIYEKLFPFFHFSVQRKVNFMFVSFVFVVFLLMNGIFTELLSFQLVYFYFHFFFLYFVCSLFFMVFQCKNLF